MRDAVGVEVASLVDVDDPETWPPDVRAQAEQWARRLRGTTDAVGDLDLSIGEEELFRSLFRHSLLIAYHATRLLRHEVEDIRTQGLRLASPELVVARAESAFRSDSIDEQLRDALIAGHVFLDLDRGDNRRGRISFVLSRQPFDHRPGGFHYLLSEWGGELITMSDKGVDLRPQLQQLGAPAIVVAALDIANNAFRHRVWPGLHHVFVGRLLQLPDLGGTVVYRDAVAAEHILDIWHPGHPEYDRHRDLPFQ